MPTTTLPETQRQRRGHGFYPTKAAKLPALYATESVPAEDKIIRAHYFLGGCDWYLVELDAETGLAFGFVNLGDPANAEWGYIDLTELEAVAVGPLRQPVERDMDWAPKPFNAIWTR